MLNNDWKYYNHALLPNCSPHKIPDTTILNNRKFINSFNKSKKFVVLARWTTEFDSEVETNWWYVIKDKPFNIDSLKAKRRYEINKGKKNFDVRLINPIDYINELVDIQRKVYECYPKQYRPDLSEVKIKGDVLKWDREEMSIYGAFSKEDNRLCGFAMMINQKEYANFAMLKVEPESEKNGVNAAIVSGILDEYNDLLSEGYYICDGERALLHETKFQDYLEKYFGFRKAYAKLHVKFMFPFSTIISLLYPIRKFLPKNNSIFKKMKVLFSFKEMSCK